MKKYLIIILVGIAIFSACKKESNSSSSTSPATAIDPTDANAVTSSVKVWHGVNVTGTAPSSTNGSSLVLDPGSSAQTISAYKGGFVVIKPTVTSGNVAGYYLKVNGASSYFKIDFSVAVHRPAAAIQHRPAGIAHHVTHHLFFRPVGDTTGDNTDSSIVIQLPAGITPGTFCISYWAYDYSGNVSNIITQCVTVDALGATDANDWTGTWKFDSEKDIEIDSTGNLLADSNWYSISDSVQAMGYQYNTGDLYNSYNRLYCYNGTITTDSSSADYILIAGYPDYYSWINESLTFSANGAYLDNYNSIEKDADYTLSTCSNIVYDRYPDQGSDAGGWSYNASTNKFDAIYQDGDSVLTTEAEEYDVVEKTSTEIILKVTDTEFGETDIGYLKLIKQ